MVPHMERETKDGGKIQFRGAGAILGEEGEKVSKRGGEGGKLHCEAHGETRVEEQMLSRQNQPLHGGEGESDLVPVRRHGHAVFIKGEISCFEWCAVFKC